jgi:hypothetical protein
VTSGHKRIRSERITEQAVWNRLLPDTQGEAAPAGLDLDEGVQKVGVNWSDGS